MGERTQRRGIILRRDVDLQVAVVGLDAGAASTPPLWCPSRRRLEPQAVLIVLRAVHELIAVDGTRRGARRGGNKRTSDPLHGVALAVAVAVPNLHSPWATRPNPFPSGFGRFWISSFSVR